MMDLQTVSTVGLMFSIAHASKGAVTDIVKRLFGPSADKAGKRMSDRFFVNRAE
jgi:hypothetical protein